MQGTIKHLEDVSDCTGCNHRACYLCSESWFSLT